SAAARPRQIPAAPRPMATTSPPPYPAAPATVIVSRPVPSGFGPNGGATTPSMPRAQLEADTPEVAPGVVLAGAWAVIAAVAVLAVLIFRIPVVFAAIAA